MANRAENFSCTIRLSDLADAS